MKKQLRKRPTTCAAKKFAQDVIAKRIVAGPTVRAECARHLSDLKKQSTADFPFYFDMDAAADVEGFFRAVVHVLVAGPDATDYSLIELLPWQRFVLRRTFGWKRDVDGTRRFRTLYIETGKGSGKSVILAGIGLYLLVADGEPEPEILVTARNKDQAKIVIRDAVNIIQMSDTLSSFLEVGGGEKNPQNISYARNKTMGFMRHVSSESGGRGKSGFRPSGVLGDELHEMRNAELIELLRKGFKARRQPLMTLATNSGEGRESVGWYYHMQAQKTAMGERIDETMTSYVCDLDEGDKPWKQESVWIKANPSLPQLPTYNYIRNEVLATRDAAPDSRNKTSRLLFCQWTRFGVGGWMRKKDWQAVQVEQLDEAALAEAPMYMGVDLSLRGDLTAASSIWQLPNNNYAVRVDYWLPEATLAQREKEEGRPYSQWAEAGIVRPVPGEFIDYRFIVRWMKQQQSRYNLKAAAFDRRYITQFRACMEEEGLEYWERDKTDRGSGLWVYEHAQGTQFPGDTDTDTDAAGRSRYKNGLRTPLWMNSSVEHTEMRIIGGKVQIEASGCLGADVADAAIYVGRGGNRFLIKGKDGVHIDGAVAMSMGVGLAEAMGDAEPEQPAAARSFSFHIGD